MSSWIAALRTKPSGSISITVTMAAPKTVRTGSAPPTCASSRTTLSSRLSTIESPLDRFVGVVECDALGMLLDDDARRAPQFGDSVGSDAEARQQCVIVDREDRQGVLQQHVVKFEPHCTGHYGLRRCSSPAERRRDRALSSGVTAGTWYGAGAGQPAARHLSAAKPWMFDG